MKILHYIGFFGPQILFITTILLLRNKPVYLFNYCIGMLFNSIFNYLLKGFIQEPRPSEDVHVFNMELNSKKLKGETLGFHRYGMPSGHAQTAFFSLMYVFLTIKNKEIWIAYLFISLVTIYQRVLYKNHSVSQVVVGAIFGMALSYCFYYYAKHILKGKMCVKLEDANKIIESF